MRHPSTPSAPTLDLPADLAAELDPPRKPYLIPAPPQAEAPDAAPHARASKGKLARRRLLAHLVYLAQCFAFLGGSGSLVGMLLAWAAEPGARGSWLESHFKWQTETFKRSILYAIPAVIAMVVAIEALDADPKILLVVFQVLFGGWYIGRVAKGWSRLWSGDPMEE